MMDDRRPTNWPDDRLADAFRARAAEVATPGDLATTTIERIRLTPRIAPVRLRLGHLGGLAAAAAVLVIVGVGLLGPRATDPGGDTASATYGLPVISVSEAIAIRDSGIDDRELAVEGFYASAGPVPCPAPPDFASYQNPARPWCPMTLNWLMERREQIVTTTAETATGRYPDGPAFNPSLSLVDASELPDAPSAVASVVLIGHFDDRRADFCPDDEHGSCSDTFVVDRINSIDGKTIETGTVRDLSVPVNDTTLDLEPARRQAAVDTLIQAIDPGLRIMSRRVTTAQRLGATEPVYLGRRLVGGFGSLVPDIAWLLVALPPVDSDGRSVARTFVIPDGAPDPILEITRNGVVPVAIAGPTTRPSETTINVDLGPGIVLEVVDIAHEIREVRLADLAGAASWVTRNGPPGTGPIMLGRIAERPNELRVSWHGGDCDRVWRLDWSDGNSLSLWPRERLATCAAEETRREIVLTLDHPVVIETIEISDRLPGE
jgi:hypothetical protein